MTLASSHLLEALALSFPAPSWQTSVAAATLPVLGLWGLSGHTSPLGEELIKTGAGWSSNSGHPPSPFSPDPRGEEHSKAAFSPAVGTWELKGKSPSMEFAWWHGHKLLWPTLGLWSQRVSLNSSRLPHPRAWHSALPQGTWPHRAKQWGPRGEYLVQKPNSELDIRINCRGYMWLKQKAQAFKLSMRNILK